MKPVKWISRTRLGRKRIQALGDYLQAMPQEPKSHWEMLTSIMRDLGDLRDWQNRNRKLNRV